ncbi:ABC transporter permease [Chitinophagaceae bacterium LWZ2-11]
MYKNYFKTAWRNLINNKIYSAINILGLAAGMAVAILIGLWVYNEYSYDKFLTEYERVYRVQRNFNSNGEILTFSTTSLKLADVLRRDIPEIEYVVESDWMGSHGLMVGDKKLYINGGQTQSDFLKVFQYPLLQGDKNTVLNDPYSIVLTESTAKALFGNENPMNKFVRVDNLNNLKVTGILKDLPANTSFNFNYLIPFSYFEQTKSWVRERRAGNFGGNSFQQFVKLKPGVTYAQVAAKIVNIEKIDKTDKSDVNGMNSEVILQPLKNWHLYGNYENGKETGGFIDYVRMFSIIGILVLLIACINFINLTTARSEKRAREVGVRKAIGSRRKQLIVQFLVESLMLCCFSFLVSILLVQLALPFFNTLTGNKISIPFTNIFFWVIMFGAICITAFIAGSRPAFYLSSFQPVKVLKGNGSVGKAAALPRKILVVTQFSCSIALIISTIIIYKQIQYAKDRPVGYDINRLMVTNMNEDLGRNYTALKNELIQKGVIENMTQASDAVTNLNWHTNLDNWSGKNANETVEMGVVLIGDDYFKTLNIPIQSGRDFVSAADSGRIIFNEAAVKRLRLKEPLNEPITWDDDRYSVVGVAKDALMLSPFSAAEPTMFLHTTKPNNAIMYRLSPTVKTQDAIAQLTATFNKYAPAYPYRYEFMDSSYADKFKLEVLIGKLAGIFAVLAVFISCLGLFGLAAYTAEQRTKEIGIRKVLGASVSQIWLLLSKDFIVLVIISCIIASPIALFMLQNWLQKYTYRIHIGAGVFILAAVMAIIITLITISFQAVKAAVSNPVRCLRTE